MKWIKWMRAQKWKDTFVFFRHEDEGTGPKLAPSSYQLAGLCVKIRTDYEHILKSVFICVNPCFRNCLRTHRARNRNRARSYRLCLHMKHYSIYHRVVVGTCNSDFYMYLSSAMGFLLEAIKFVGGA